MQHQASRARGSGAQQQGLVVVCLVEQASRTAVAEAGVQAQAGSLWEVSPSWHLTYLWYLCLRFYTFSTAKHCHGAAPTATCATGPGRGRHSPAVPSHHGAAFQPLTSRCSLSRNSRRWTRLWSHRQSCLSWAWVLLRILTVDTAPESGSTGSIPNLETHCSVMERSGKYPPILGYFPAEQELLACGH